MREIPGWEGPICLAEGAYRYSKYISWIRLFIDVQIDEQIDGQIDEWIDEKKVGRGMVFSGGATGACQNFELRQEGGQWMRYEMEIAWTAKGEPVLRLMRDYSSWDLVYNCVSNGRPVDERIDSIEELAEYLERCLI
ncbi:MAG TPA: hypothetical protein PLY52_04785 [Methanothrix sp.]|uniref:hypothetical protein n=2 Tax=Methanothrix sp. TaxID=90426 RepID=UPI002CBD8B1C|nr:hypothetical protein [Methanothrix sp.]MDI9417443.1 hypothetical protein [Euryarchaeota archaeon]HON35609.1 hypothetical protein [Methanothrix sp.]HRU74744.1 hypothetical protein [Methanothrix sp.]